MKMNIKLLSAVAICNLCAMAMTSGTAMAQATKTVPSAKEVLANYVKAVGGEEAYKSVKSMHSKGTLTMVAQGISAKIENKMAAGGKMLTVVDIPNLGSEKGGSDGKTFWSQSSFTGIRILKDLELLQQQMAGDMQLELHPEKYFKSMKVTGVDTVKGEECYRLERVTKLDTPQIDFYSVKSGLQVKSEVEVSSPLGKMQIQSFPSDYRKIGKMMVPHKVEQVMGAAGKILIEMKEVKINGEMDAATFKLPEQVAKMKAKADAKK